MLQCSWWGLLVQISICSAFTGTLSSLVCIKVVFECIYGVYTHCHCIITACSEARCRLCCVSCIWSWFSFLLAFHSLHRSWDCCAHCTRTHRSLVWTVSLPGYNTNIVCFTVNDIFVVLIKITPLCAGDNAHPQCMKRLINALWANTVSVLLIFLGLSAGQRCTLQLLLQANKYDSVRLTAAFWANAPKQRNTKGRVQLPSLSTLNKISLFLNLSRLMS